MLRRSAQRLFSQGPEATRRRNQAIRAVMWNPDGTLNLKGAVYYLWDWIGFPAKFVVGLLTFGYFYNQFLIKIEAQASRDTRECQTQHPERIRASGRLKDERHIEMQNRRIEDPDFPDNLPGFSATYQSRITDDDEYQRATSTDERKYSH